MKSHLSNLFYWLAIFIVAISMTLYGITKPIQFDEFTIATPDKAMTGHQVMWMFYGYSKSYPILIGLLEMAGSVLLLFGRTRLFAVLLLSIILSNIIIQDYIYEIAALPVAIFYQFLLCVVAVYDWDKVKEVAVSLFQSPHKTGPNWVVLGIAATLACLFVLFETRIVNAF